MPQNNSPTKAKIINAVAGFTIIWQFFSSTHKCIISIFTSDNSIQTHHQQCTAVKFIIRIYAAQIYDIHSSASIPFDKNFNTFFCHLPHHHHHHFFSFTIVRLWLKYISSSAQFIMNNPNIIKWNCAVKAPNKLNSLMNVCFPSDMFAIWLFVWRHNDKK